MLFYFARSSRGGYAHKAGGTTRSEILLGGNYKTKCGRTVSPKNWTLLAENELTENHHVCYSCRRET
jgi:hypothetical protein